MNRVPGAVYVVPHSLGHSVDPSAVNVTHTIKHLSFGKHVPGRPSYVPRSLRRVWRRIPKDLGGRFAAGGETTFASEEPFTVHEHHLKVVGRTYEPLEGDPVHLYEYTFNSNRFRLAPRDLEGESDRHIDGAAVKFSYDLSPMRVVSRETRRPTTEWLLGLCAWVGGGSAASASPSATSAEASSRSAAARSKSAASSAAGLPRSSTQAGPSGTAPGAVGQRCEPAGRADGRRVGVDGLG